MIYQGSEVGKVTKLSIIIRYMMDGKQKHILYEEIFPILSYYVFRVLNDCYKIIFFDGCGIQRTTASRYLRGNPVEIKTIVWKENCQGTRNIGTKWRLQRDEGYEGEYDPVPVDLEFGGTSSIKFHPRFFTDGDHMLEVEVTVMGDPPHYGGPTVYQVYGRCYIKIELGPMLLHARGGNKVSLSCLVNLEIDLVSDNPGLLLSEMVFIMRCRILSPDPSTTDPECKERKTEVPTIRKINTPCDTVYEYNITAIHSISKHRKQEMTVVVHFIKNHVRLSINCMFNCYPLDTKYKTVLVATTEPYVPASIEWVVVVGNKTMNPLDYEPTIRAFYPLSTTRVLRVDGNYLHSATQSLTTVSVTASVIGTPQLRATLEIVTNYLFPEINKFVLYKVPPEIAIYPVASDVNFGYEPVEYRLFQINNFWGDSLLLDTSLNKYLRATPFFLFDPSLCYIYYYYLSNKLQMKLCVQDSMQMRDCSYTAAFYWNDFPNLAVSDSNLMFQYEIGDVRRLLLLTAIYINNQLEYKVRPEFFGTPKLIWIGGEIDKQREWILNLMQKLRDLRETEIQTIIYILTMTFFSPEGNESERFAPFIDPFLLSKVYIISSEDYRAWMNTRVSALTNLHIITEWAWKNGNDHTYGQLKLTDFEYGDILDGIIRCWNLAHLQSITVKKVSEDLKMKSTHNDDLDAQFRIINRENEKRLMKTLSLFVKTIFYYSRLFYGLRDIGIMHTRIWMIRTTYQGILAAFNQNNTGEELLGYSDFIFGPVRPGEEWLRYAQLQFPDLETVVDLMGKELFFAVGIVGNREYDTTISPTLLIYMSRKKNKPYHQLPNGAEYTVTLPLLINGTTPTLSNERFFTDSIQRPSNDSDKLKYFTVYKVILPSDFQEWDLRIITSNETLIKVKVNFDTLPEYENVANLEPIKPTYKESSKLYITALVVKPKHGRTTISRDFYIGLLLTNDTPADTKISIKVRYTVDICWIHDLDMEGSQETCKGKQLREELTIDCVCNKFGVIVARATPIRFTRILMTPIDLSVQVSISPVQLSLPLFMAVIVVVLILTAIFSDRSRKKKEVLILMKDTRPLDTYPLIIGVFTSPNLMGGTFSTVAIKVEGRSSSSRVHLLNCKSRALLKRGNDDWFVLTTNQPLGKIQHILLWHDYHCLSNWYCHYVLIYDIKQENWYMASVNRWFRLYPSVDESRFAQIRTYKFSNFESGLKAMPSKFKYHMISETRNCHYFISMFRLHLRSMYSFENRTLAFLIKLLAIFFGTWVIQVRHLFHDPHDKDNSEPTIQDIHFDEDSILIVIIIDAISYAFTIPYMLLVRTTFMSGLIQKKTTNPQNMDVIRKEQVTVGAEKKVGRTDKSQPLEKQQRSVLFQLDSTDRTESAQSWMVHKPGEEHQPKSRKTWTATHFQHSRVKKIMTLLFGPCQFRCINVSSQIFDVKMSKRIFYSRLFAAFMIVLGLAFVAYVEEFTNFGAKYSVTLYYMVLTLFMDFFIFNPFVILLNTFVMFVFLQTSNREYHLWSDNVKLTLPKPLSFVQYFHTATKKAYKPLLSSEIEKITKKSTIYHAIRICFLYAFVIMCIVFIVQILSTRYDKGYYLSVRTIQAAAEQDKLSTGIRGAGSVQTNILEVNRPKKVAEFIPVTFGELQLSWPNGQRIDATKKHSYWFLDRESRIIGPVSVLITCISTKKQLKIPKYFTKLFSNAHGFLSESKVEDKSIVLSDRDLNYTRLDPLIQLRGKSGSSYALVGYQAVIPTNSWTDYYVSLTTTIEDLNKRVDVVPRVVIISYNIITANTYRLSTVDLIVEFLPSGECSAVVHVTSIRVRSIKPGRFALLRKILIVLALVHLSIAIVDISTLGFKTYIIHSYGITKVALSASGVFLCITTTVCYFPKYMVLDKLFSLPSDKYLDMHGVQERDLWDSCALALFLLVLCIDFALAVKDALGLQIISAASTKGFRMSLTMLLIIMIYSRAAATSTNVFAKSYNFMVAFFSRTVFPLAAKDDEIQMFLVGAITILCVFSKFCLAIFIYQFEVFDGDYVSDYHPGRSAAVLSKLKPLRDTKEVKMQYIKKHSVYVKEPSTDDDSKSKSKSSMKSKESKSPSSKTSEPLSEGERKLEARASKLERKMFLWF